MSLESGRKLGLIASLIAIGVPVVTVILYGFLILSLFGVFSSAVTGGSPTLGGSFFSVGIIIAFVVIGVVGIAGVVLFLVSMHRLSQYYSEPGIFKNALYGFLISIVGAAVIFVAILVLLFATVLSIAAHPITSSSPFGFAIAILGVGVAAFVMTIVSAVFYKRAFDELGEKSGVSSFGTAGTLYLVGTALTIILVGSIIIWVAWIEAASGFYSLKPKTDAPPAVPHYIPQQPAAITAAEKKYCVYCGEEISLDSLFCPHCGKPVQQ